MIFANPHPIRGSMQLRQTVSHDFSHCRVVRSEYCGTSATCAYWASFLLQKVGKDEDLTRTAFCSVNKGPNCRVRTVSGRRKLVARTYLRFFNSTTSPPKASLLLQPCTPQTKLGTSMLNVQPRNPTTQAERKSSSPLRNTAVKIT